MRPRPLQLRLFSLLLPVCVSCVLAAKPLPPRNLSVTAADASAVLRWDHAPGSVEWHYLFAPCMVFASRSPTNFDVPLLSLLCDETGTTKGAVEVIHAGDDDWYIAGYGKGIWLARLAWQTPGKGPAASSR